MFIHIYIRLVGDLRSAANECANEMVYIFIHFISFCQFILLAILWRITFHIAQKIKKSRSLLLVVKEVGWDKNIFETKKKITKTEAYLMIRVIYHSIQN